MGKNKFLARISFFFTVIFFLPVMVFSQNITLTVHGQRITGKTLRITYFDDRISLLEKDLQTLKVDEGDTSAIFQMSFADIKEVAIKINMQEFHFLARPGYNYSLYVNNINDSAYNFAQKDILDAVISMEKDDRINDPVADFDNAFDDFLFSNDRLLFLKDSVSVSEFNQLENKYLIKYQGNSYMQNYIKYQCAGIRYSLNLSSKQKIKSMLFQNSDILYDNIGYTDCFRTIFSHYFSLGNRFISKYDMEHWLQTSDYKSFDDALGRDSVLRNEIFRQLVFLQGMKDAFLDGLFQRNDILRMLDVFISATKFPELKNIALNLKEYLPSRDFANKSSKDFIFKDVDSNSVTLSSFGGNPIVLCFVRLNEISSLKELKTLSYYYDKVKNNCNIVVISIDEAFETMYNFVKNTKTGKDYKFPILHFNFDFGLIEYYKVRFLPDFVLLKSDLSIEENPADFPSMGGLEKFIND